MARRAPQEGGPWAKAQGGDGRQLNGYRHEFGSLIEAEAHPEVQALPEDLRDLVLHLIAAHHGWARPLLRADGCAEDAPSRLAVRAGAAAQRFARLGRRLGLGDWPGGRRCCARPTDRPVEEEGAGNGRG